MTTYSIERHSTSLYGGHATCDTLPHTYTDKQQAIYDRDREQREAIALHATCTYHVIER